MAPEAAGAAGVSGVGAPGMAGAVRSWSLGTGLPCGIPRSPPGIVSASGMAGVAAGAGITMPGIDGMAGAG
jgi:hypothetical protein